MKLKTTFKPRKGPIFSHVSPSKRLPKIRAKGIPFKQPPYLTIDRHVQHIDRGMSSNRVHFKDLDGKPKWLDIPRKLFLRQGEVISLLLDAHAELPSKQKDIKLCVTDALEKARKKTTLNITDRLGWDNNSGDGCSFVYYGKTFGPAHDTLQLDHDSNRNSALGKKEGKIEAWRVGLEEPCRFSEHLVLAISIAASGPLYAIIGNPEPAIYHFQGARADAKDDGIRKSSSGKTLTARAGQSMFGACTRMDLYGYNMTALALEETCFSCNNLTVVLDEEGAAGKGGTGQFINRETLPYCIINGQGRRRSKTYTVANALSNRFWVVPVITTSEDELDVGKSKRKEGAQVRMVAIPFPATSDGGTFVSVENEVDRNRLALQIETTIAANYGVAMPTYLRNLARDHAKLAPDIISIRDGFVCSVGATGNSWEKRYAEKFGMTLAGALLLARYGIAPWTPERANEAITNLYNASRALTVSVPQATDALLDQLRELVAAKTHFPRVGKGQTLTEAQKKEFWGCVREIGANKNVTAVPMARLRKLVQPAAVTDQVLDELVSRKLLVKDPNGSSTRQVSIKGITKKRARYVCIKGLVAQ